MRFGLADLVALALAVLTFAVIAGILLQNFLSE
jgi:hypothetical protein